MTMQFPVVPPRPTFTVALGLALVVGVGWVDFITGRDVSLQVLYLPGVVIVAWFGRSLLYMGLCLASPFGFRGLLPLFS